MSPDIRETLQGAARSPKLPVDPADLRQRGSRRRTGQLLGGTALALVVGIAGVTALTGDRPIDRPPVIAPAPSPSPTSTAEPGPAGTDATSPAEGTVTPRMLDASVATAQNGTATVTVRHRDGSATTHELGDGERTRWYPGLDGSIWWQDWSDSRFEGSPPIHHTSVDQEVTMVVAGTRSFEESWQLVGDGLVTHRTGGGNPDTANSDLLRIDREGTTELLVERVGGWESGLSEAVAMETILYSGGGEGSEWVHHVTPEGEITTVIEGGEMNGEDIEGVASIGGGQWAVLVVTPAGFPDLAEARVLIVDDTGAITQTIDVPVDLGTSTWNVPSWISGNAGHLLVNRYAEGPYIEALVLNVTTREWSVFAEPGLSKFADTASDPDPTPTSTCATEDGDLRNAPPGDTYWLYWPCEGSPDLFDLYRVEPWSPPNSGPTGGVTVASFVRMHLEAMLEGPSTDALDSGHTSILPSSAGVQVASVTENGDLDLIVDFTIAPGGTGWRNESAASAMWARQLASHLFQLHSVRSVQLRLDGSCDAYSAWFEGDGCTVLTPADAAWNA